MPGRIHDWKMEVESESLNEARDNETEDLWGWVNSHGDRLDLKRTEERAGDDVPGFAEEHPDEEFGPRYTVLFTPATESAAEAVSEGEDVELEVEEPHGLYFGDARSETGPKVSEFLSTYDPETLGYDGLGEVHDNGRDTSTGAEQATEESEVSDGLKEAMMGRMRDKHSDDEGELDYSSLKEVAGDYNVSPVGKDAETLLEALVDSRVEEQQAA